MILLGLLFLRNINQAKTYRVSKLNFNQLSADSFTSTLHVDTDNIKEEGAFFAKFFAEFNFQP